jgi:hypothetical protein
MYVMTKHNFEENDIFNVQRDDIVILDKDSRMKNLTNILKTKPSTDLKLFLQIT